MQIIASDTHRLHETFELSRGQFVESAEGPARADIIATALRSDGYELNPPDQIDDALLTRIHTPQYIDFLSTVWERWIERFGPDIPAMGFTWPSRGVTPVRPDDLVGELGYHSFAADCSIVAGTWTAVVDAAAIAQTAADRVIAGEGSSYGLCRPPGHHATADQFGGYCYINNTAIATQRLLDSGRDRVAILDVDYHHGNGTQDIFYGRSDVLTVSIHADPTFEFPWFAGHASETGDGKGDGWNLNIPLPRACELDRWLNALTTALDRIKASGADALVVALGVDTYVDDPLGTFVIRGDDYATIAGRIAAADLPTVIIQEGGYAVDAIGTNVARFLDPFRTA